MNYMYQDVKSLFGLRRRVCRAVLSLAVVMLLSACSDADNPAIQVQDVIAPTVTAVEPIHESVGVSVDADILAQFSEDMFAITIDADADTFRLFDTGQAVSGVVQYDAFSRVATFLPTAPLGLLKDYRGQLMTGISDLSGNGLAQAVSWSFSTQDGLWDSAQERLISDPLTSNSPVFPLVVINGNGHGLAVWREIDINGQFNIVYSRYDSGAGTWGLSRFLLLDSVGGTLVGGSRPQLVMDAEGNALVVWVSKETLADNSVSFRIKSARIPEKPSFNRLVIIEDISQAVTFSPEALQVGIDDVGNVIVIWRQDSSISNNTSFSIWANRYAAGQWGLSDVIGVEPGVNFSKQTLGLGPRLALGSGGNALVVWSQRRAVDGVYEVAVNRFDVGDRGWTEGDGLVISSAADAESSYDLDSNANANQPVVVVDDQGNVTVVWLQAAISVASNVEANPAALWSRYFDVTAGTDGAWRDIERRDVKDGSGVAVTTPHLTVNSQGDAILTWEQAYSVEVSRYTAGLGWSRLLDSLVTVVIGDSDIWYPGLYPQAFIDNNGNSIVAWTFPEVSPDYYFDEIVSYQFQAQRHVLADVLDGDLSTGFGGVTAIAPSFDSAAIVPEFALSMARGSGYAAAIWTQDRGDGEREIRINRFAPL